MSHSKNIPDIEIYAGTTIRPSDRHLLSGWSRSVGDLTKFCLVDYWSKDKAPIDLAKSFVEDGKIITVKNTVDVFKEEGFSGIKNTLLDFIDTQTLGKAKERWVLLLDADERLAFKGSNFFISSVSNELKRIIISLPRVTNVIRFEIMSPTLNFIEQRELSQSVSVRMIRIEPGTSYIGSIHEYVYPQNQPYVCKAHVEGVFVAHLGYDLSREEMTNKAERNLRMLLNALHDNPSNIHLKLHLMRTYNAIGSISQAMSIASEIITNVKEAGFEAYQEAIMTADIYNNFIKGKTK